MQDHSLHNIIDMVEGLNEDRYLDGNTFTGTVQLVRHTAEPFTGAKWLRSTGPEDKTVFTCLGASDGPRMLDGHPGPNTVQLQPNTGFLGTRWSIEVPVWHTSDSTDSRNGEVEFRPYGLPDRCAIEHRPP
ncbi:hypothetical protein [Streptomyces sp. NPDC058664]|uniref:hypothetical protein n=1 Tax=unclassified Streptomyces TaxID=2593676 RepID=UPI0036477433